MALTLSIVSCNTSPAIPDTDIAMLIDQTDTMTSYPSADGVTAPLGLQQNPWQGVRVRLAAITDKDINETTVISLDKESEWSGNRIIRMARVQRFKRQLAAQLATMKANHPCQHSIVFRTVARQAKALAASPCRNRYLLVWSDLYENDEVNFYDSQIINLIKTSPQGIRRKLEATNAIADLHGLKVSLLFTPTSYKQNNRYMVIANFYQQLLTAHGATVHIDSKVYPFDAFGHHQANEETISIIKIMKVISILLQVVQFALGLLLDFLNAVIDLFTKNTGFNAAFGRETSIASRFNTGFVVSKNRKLCRRKSFENVLLCGPTGSGKTTRLLLKNLYSLKNCSLIVNDPSKELYKLSSGYLSKYFTIQTLSFSDSAASVGFNILSRIKKPNDINKVAHLLVAASLDKGNSSDPFWSLQSKTLLQLLIRLTLLQPEQYCNMANVVHLLHYFSAYPEKIDVLIAQSNDEKLILDYKSFISTPEKTLQNIVASAKAALQLFDDPEITRTTAKSRCGNYVCIQSPTQLKSSYKDEAENIAANCVTKIYLPGQTSMEVLREIETLGGKCIYIDEKKTERVKPLITADEIQIGMLNGTPGEIAMAKKEYRKVYKREWKKLPRNTKEVRFIINQNQYEAISKEAGRLNAKISAYARAAILQSIESNGQLHNRDALLKTLQIVGMASIRMMRNTISYSEALALILDVETRLLHIVET
eukprot:gene7928-8000_t